MRYLYDIVSGISIHSLHTEGDAIRAGRCGNYDISIHSLHTEGDEYIFKPSGGTALFQSTPSTRRETIIGGYPLQGERISIHSLHTEGDGVMAGVLVVDFLISIHSLHTEGDREVLRKTQNRRKHFNPLPPHGGRRLNPDNVILVHFISIHSLHTEGDQSKTHKSNFEDISIHSLHTEGDSGSQRQPRRREISIHSLHTEGDRGTAGCFLPDQNISIHSLHTEGDLGRPDANPLEHLFQSTPSTRRETTVRYLYDIVSGISIHSLHTEGDHARG